MTPEKKSKMILPSNVVKLKPIEEVNWKQFPTVMEDMKQYFGGCITVCSNILPMRREKGYEYIFNAEEGYAWNIKWLDECNFSHLPEELFEID